MKILEWFSRRPPEPLSPTDQQNPKKRNIFRKQFSRHYGRDKAANLSWINHEGAWYLVCPAADSAMLKRYDYLRRIRPEKASMSQQNFWEQKKGKKSAPQPIICYVNPDRSANCPLCNQGYRNVSGPFPKKVTCRNCQAVLRVELLHEK